MMRMIIHYLFRLYPSSCGSARCVKRCCAAGDPSSSRSTERSVRAEHGTDDRRHRERCRVFTHLSEAGIAAIFGTNLGTDVCPVFASPLPTTLCGTAVTMDGISLPEFYVSPDQMNVVLPFGTGERTVSVITPSGTTTKTVTLHDHAPASTFGQTGLLRHST